MLCNGAKMKREGRKYVMFVVGKGIIVVFEREKEKIV